MSDDFDVDEYQEIEIPEQEGWPLDSVAARTYSFTRLVALVDHIKNEDALRETILMLRAVRFSFKQLPQADLSVIQGEKK